MFDLSFYALALLVHVGAAFVLVGGTLFAPLVRRAIVTADTLGLVRLWVGFGQKAHKANPAAAFVLLGTGIYLGSAGWWNAGWFYVSLAAWLVNSLLAVAVVNRTVEGLAAEVASREGPVDGRVDAIRRSQRWAMAENVMLASDASMIYVMFVKPSVVECVVVIAAFIGLAVVADRWASRGLISRGATTPAAALAADTEPQG